MATQAQTSTRSEHDPTVEKMIQEVRQLYADAPQLATKALQNAFQELCRR